MDAELQKMFDLQFFKDEGFHRKACEVCQADYWTLDADRTNCGDSTCTEYTFLGKPLSKKPLGVAEMREAFLAYWENKGHARVPRNPVVARWRDDLYLNIASIANYQPHTTSGDVPPPANPLVVSQPCIRLNDLANIGRSGRHFSCFEMMGHHAFNNADDPEWGDHYWTEECVSGGHEFLTKILGLEPKSLTYTESEWAGGGNAGPCFEVFAGGLEVATLVFMCLQESDDETGEFDIKGTPYNMMPLRIIDTGWGLERLAWASTGTPTAYDTVFPEILSGLRAKATVEIADDERSQKIIETHALVQGVLNLDVGMKLDALRAEVVERLKDHGLETTVAELETLMGPVEDLYCLADHLRCLSFMVGDGLVPGNVKAGYLMRLVFRRAFRFAGNLGIKEPLSQLLAENMRGMLDQFPEFEAAIPHAVEMADLELERYEESRERGLRLVDRVLGKKKELTTEDLVEMYDTHGLGPNTVAEAAAKKGITVEIPDDFDLVLAERHSSEKKNKVKAIVPAEIPTTELLFYSDQEARAFDAKVLWTGTVDGKDAAVLDRTAFFWETGGQPGDKGQLTGVSVVGMKKDGDHAIHLLDAPLKVGQEVQGMLDWELRMDHTRSHTATHIMNASVRHILGAHSFQAGTQKYANCARVDMSHYRRPSSEELAEIEALANRVVMEGLDVTRTWWNREEAESKYGMTLLQGGIPKGRAVRVVEIAPLDGQKNPFDVEYCGGTHCSHTGEVGPIKLYRTERVQDGVERFEYSAGQHAVTRWQSEQTLLRDAAKELDVTPDDLPKAANRFFGEWKEQRKLLAELQSQLAELKAQAAAGDAEEINGVRLIVQTVDQAAMQQTAQELVAQPNTVALLGTETGRLLFGRSPDVDVNMGSVLREAAAVMGGKGGGRPDFAQGAGPDASKLDEALEKAAELVRAEL